MSQQSRTLQWSIGYTTTGTGPYSDRCIQKRLGDCLSRDRSRVSVAQEGKGSTYKSAGISSHKVCHLDICQNVGNVSYTHPVRQDGSLELFAENGSDKESRSKADLKGNLGVSTWAGITITAEHLPGNLNCEANWKSCHQKDSSEWKLRPLIFSKICQKLGKRPEIDLFVLRLSNQLPSYYSCKPDPNSLGTDALQQNWYHKSLYAFSPFALIHKELKKVEEEKVSSLIIVTPTWQTQSWYPELLRLSVRNPIILLLKDDLLKGPQNQHHPLIQNRTIQLAVWVVSESVWQRKEYQKGRHTLLSHQEEKVLSQLTHRPGISRLAGVLNKTLIQFDVMETGS